MSPMRKDAHLPRPGLVREVRETGESLARELSRLGGVALQLQDLLTAVDREPLVVPDAQGLQSLDLLTQGLCGLAEFMVVLSPYLPCTEINVAPALATVRLSDMAARLSGEERDPQPSGVLELF